MTDDTLPTLPRPASLSDHSIAPFVGQYSADQMRTYAAEAVRAALAAQVPQPVAWLCEWIDPEDQSITWHQYHDASDPMPDKWDDPPQRVTPLAAAPGASPPAALAVPDELRAGFWRQRCLEHAVEIDSLRKTLGIALVALEYHRDQTRPIELSDEAIAALRSAASQESATTRGRG